MKDILDGDIIEKKETPFFKINTVIIWLSITFVGFVLRVMYLPFSNVFILVSSASLFAYSLTAIRLAKERTTLSMIITLLGGVWTIFMIIGLFLLGGYPYSLMAIWNYFIVFVIMLIVYEYSIKKKSKKNL